MHTVHKDFRVYLVDRNNDYQEFESYEKFIDYTAKAAYYRRQGNSIRWWHFESPLHYAIRDIGNNWNDTYQTCDEKYRTVVSTVDYILLDANFKVINTTKIKIDIDKYVHKGYNRCYRRFKDYEWLGFRTGPVPGTGVGRWHFRSYYKRPKTTQERRASHAHNGYVRAKRNDRHLPNTWDDIHKKYWNRRCWKDCTKKHKQWE